MDALEEAEQKIFEKVVHPAVQNTFKKGDYKFEGSLRKWILIHFPEASEPTSDLDKTRSGVIMEDLFLPEDMGAVSLMSLFYLRFPDFSPLFPWRDFKNSSCVSELNRVCAVHCSCFRLNSLFLANPLPLLRLQEPHSSPG
jgi:hypothetical protein